MTREPRPAWCSVFGLPTRTRSFSQSTPHHRKDKTSLGHRRPPYRHKAMIVRHVVSGAASSNSAVIVRVIKRWRSEASPAACFTSSKGLISTSPRRFMSLKNWRAKDRGISERTRGWGRGFGAVCWFPSPLLLVVWEVVVDSGIRGQGAGGLIPDSCPLPLGLYRGGLPRIFMVSLSTSSLIVSVSLSLPFPFPCPFPCPFPFPLPLPFPFFLVLPRASARAAEDI